MKGGRVTQNGELGSINLSPFSLSLGKEGGGAAVPLRAQQTFASSCLEMEHHLRGNEPG